MASITFALNSAEEVEKVKAFFAGNNNNVDVRFMSSHYFKKFDKFSAIFALYSLESSYIYMLSKRVLNRQVDFYIEYD